MTNRIALPLLAVLDLLLSHTRDAPRRGRDLFGEAAEHAMRRSRP